MLPIVLAHPLAAKSLINFSLPWLITSTTIGGLFGHTTEKHQQHQRQIAQLKTALQQTDNEIEQLTCNLEKTQHKIIQLESDMAENRVANNTQFSDALQVAHTTPNKASQPIDEETVASPNNYAEPLKTSLLARLFQSNIKLRKDVEK